MATIYHQGDPDLIFTRHNDRDHLIGDNEHKYKTKRLDEIEKSLEQDRKRLSSITEALERNDKLTMRMESIFLSLTGRLESIENKFMTIYEESGRLKQLNLTLEHLDPVIGHYQVIESTISIMSQGPTGRLKEYLCCLDRIKRATDYFEEVIPEGPELKALRVSQNSAKKQLLSEFKRLLLKCCKPASPIAILNLIDGEEVLGTQKENVGIPGPVLQDMASISAWFLEDYSSLDYLLVDTEDPLQSAKKLKTQSLDRGVCGGSPKKKRIASWLSNKLKTCSLDRPPTLGPLPYSKEESPLHELPDINEEEFPLTMESSPSRLKTRSLDRLESPNTFKAPFPGSPFTRKTTSWKKGKMKILSLERHPGFLPVHAQSVSNFVEVIEEDSLSASKRQSSKNLKTQSLDRDTCGGSPKKKRIASWLSNKLKTRSLDRPPTLGPLPHSREESPLHELPDITEEEFPLTMESSPSRLKTRSLDRLESPNTFKAPFPGSPFTRKTTSWKKGKMKILSLERHPGFVPVHAQSVSDFVEVIEEDSLSASKRQSSKNLKTQSLDRDTCGGSPKKKRIASWLSNKLKTRSLDRPPTLGPLPHSREESPLHELPDITEEEFPLTMESSPSRLKTRSLDRLESPNTFKAPFPGSPFTRKTTSWKKGKMKILSLERHPGFVPVHAQSVSNLLEDIEEDSLSASKRQSAKNLKTQSLDRDTCGGSPKKKRIASWLSNKLKTRSLDRPPTLGPLPHSREEFPLHELSDCTKDEFPLTMASSPSGLKTRSLDRLMSPNTFKAPFPGSPFTRKTMSWKKGKMKTRSLERHPGFVPVQRVFIFTVYSEARSCHMHQSLKDFRDHLRMRSASSTSSLNSLSSASSSSWSLSSSSPSSRSSFRGTLKRFFNRLGKEDWLDIDVDCFSQCLKAFSLLAGVEFSALAEVFPEHYWKRTFDPLVQQALDLLTEEGEYIIFAARQAVNVHHDYGALLMVLRAHDTLKVTQPSIDTVLEHTSDKTRNKLPNLIKSMGNFARQAMEKYSSTILDEWYKKKEMPEDGTVHELTSNVILFLSKLMQSRSTADLFTSREPGNDIQDCEGVDDDITCLRPFISEVLEQLFLSLDDMASTYKDPYLKAIYLFNNYNYIHKSMSRAPLRCVVWEGGAGEAQATWERRAEEQKQKYLQSWLAVTQHLKDDGILHVQPGSKLQEKQRHLIKGKFQSFNASLEELIRVQGEWAISDPEQREALSRAQAYGVGQAYRAFLQRYEQVKFTSKHPQKYYKYTTREVEEMITSFFDSLI